MWKKAGALTMVVSLVAILSLLTFGVPSTTYAQQSDEPTMTSPQQGESDSGAQTEGGPSAPQSEGSSGDAQSQGDASTPQSEGGSSDSQSEGNTQSGQQ